LEGAGIRGYKSQRKNYKEFPKPLLFGEERKTAFYKCPKIPRQVTQFIHYHFYLKE
jgi:hypothetical protein